MSPCYSRPPYITVAHHMVTVGTWLTAGCQAGPDLVKTEGDGGDQPGLLLLGQGSRSFTSAGVPDPRKRLWQGLAQACAEDTHSQHLGWVTDRPRNVWWHLPAFAQYPQHFEGLLLSPTVGAPCSILGSKLSFYFSRLVSMPNSRFPVWMHPGRTAACRKQLSFTSPLGPGKSHGLLGYGATLSNLCSSRTGHSLNCHLFVGC